MSLIKKFLRLSRFFSPSCASCGKRLNGFMHDAEGYQKYGMAEWLMFQSNPNRIIEVIVCANQSDGRLGCGSLRCIECWKKAKKCPSCGSIGITKGLAIPDSIINE
jgi:hypothetical protein